MPVWNPVAQAAQHCRGEFDSENAHAFALLNMAMQDAAVATFRYEDLYNFWRPETAIGWGYLMANR